ncbi:MAG: hypothetical protein JXA01_00595 [Dehalococcoidia bacterium]|nr:hypothetical protein [Dehalococcoidia bacterium]
MPAKRKSEKKPLICRCVCPYCDAELLVAESPFCEVCKRSFGRCSHCGAIILEEKITVCKSCGKPLA